MHLTRRTKSQGQVTFCASSAATGGALLEGSNIDSDKRKAFENATKSEAAAAAVATIILVFFKVFQPLSLFGLEMGALLMNFLAGGSSSGRNRTPAPLAAACTS